MVRAILYVLALLNVAWGVFALVRPAVAGRFVGLEPTSAHGTGELRAVYGALVIAIGLLVGLAARADGGEQWLRALAVMFAAIACGRLVSLAFDGVNGYTLAALGLEGGTAVLLAWAAKALPS